MFAIWCRRYSFRTLPAVVSSTREMFQEVLTTLLSQLMNVRVSINEKYAKTRELQKTVGEVIDVLKKSGFKLNKDKYIF